MNLMKPMKPMKPMLARDWIESKVKFPCIIQPKIDGVRALCIDGKLVGRSLKPFANKYVTHLLSRPEFSGFDGEITVGTPDNRTSETLCRDTTSALNRIDGEPIVTWTIFDTQSNEEYCKRLLNIGTTVGTLPERMFFNDAIYIRVIGGSTARNMKELLAYESQCLDMGYEGVILRDPDGLYKEGRSDSKMQCWRIKRFIEEEVLVTKILEGSKNNNEKKVNELGRTERSSHQENMQPNGEVGTIIGTLLKDIFHPVTGNVLFKEGLEVQVSPGEMTQEECKFYWSNQEQIVGKVIKFKTFPQGVKDKPRFPTFVCFRDKSEIVK